MTSAKKRALALEILAGCSDGSTEAALAMHGITRACLDELVASGAVEVKTITLVTPPMTVRRFYKVQS
jgi:hypothetical protein